MKIPDGISNFESLKTEGYLYIDKTKYIEILEGLGSKYVFFIRPRRFGKSLFLSTLACYYDINAKGKFNRLFGDLYIGQKPTPLKHTYLVLKLNFSGLNTENKENLENSFRLSLVNDIRKFLNNYNDIFKKDVDDLKEKLSQIQDIKSVLEFILEQAQIIDKKIYLIIDEYDHFANDIIAMGEGHFYKEIVRATGFVRDFYETIKIGTESVIDRIFITGISPVMLDDLTSGFNIATNLTLTPQLNEMMGFTEEEVRCIIDVLDIEISMPATGKKLSKQELLQELHKNYNGYLFNPKAKNRVYHPNMTLYFFKESCFSLTYPEKIIDDNIKTDYGRLNRLTVNEENKKVLDEIIKNENIAVDLATRFSFDTMYDREYFVSLLFYMGLLTIGGKKYGQIKLEIPNYVTREVFWEYLQKRIRLEFGLKLHSEELAKAIWEIGAKGKITPFIDYISENVLNVLSNRDLIRFDEKYIKVLLFAYLTVNKLYRLHSELETEQGYVDIYLEIAPHVSDLKYEWLMELKYLKESERNKLEGVKQKGLEQLERYVKSKKLLDKKNLKKCLLIFIGKKDCIIVER